MGLLQKFFVNIRYFLKNFLSKLEKYSIKFLDGKVPNSALRFKPTNPHRKRIKIGLFTMESFIRVIEVEVDDAFGVFQILLSICILFVALVKRTGYFLIRWRESVSNKPACSVFPRFFEFSR